METQTRLSRHNKFISAENIVGIFSVSSDDSFYMLWDNTEHVKESSDETENIPTMFSAEINLLWRLNRVWVSI